MLPWKLHGRHEALYGSKFSERSKSSGNPHRNKRPWSCSRSVANNIIELANEAEGPAKKHKVFVPSIICRCDSTLSNKVRTVNNLLSSPCHQYSWSFIYNSNILENHLNNDGIYLNIKGTYIHIHTYVYSTSPRGFSVKCVTEQQ